MDKWTNTEISESETDSGHREPKEEIDETNIQVDFIESETTSGHNEPIEIEEEKPKPILFKRYYEPIFVARKLKRRK